MKLRITNVDHDGYNGRDHHPADTDIGQVVTVLGLQVDHYTETGEWHQMLDGGIVAYPDLAQQYDNLVYCYTCVTPDGRTLELMGHEVEVVR